MVLMSDACDESATGITITANDKQLKFAKALRPIK